MSSEESEITLPPEKDWSAETVNASLIEMKPIRWLWRSWLPKGKLTILAGQAGTGKTNLALQIAATVSRGGQWPDGTKAPVGNILIWSGEDDHADVIVPRLQAMGADLAAIYLVQASVNKKGKKRAFEPSADMPLLAKTMAEARISLLIIDPIISAVRGDMNQANSVRTGLQSVVELAAAHDAAVIGVSHFSKGSRGADPADRVLGSQAFGALARMVLVAARDDEGRGVFARAKTNIAVTDGGFEYRVEPVTIPGKIETTAIRWGDVIAGSAKNILAEVDGCPPAGEPSSLKEAKGFLREILTKGLVPTTQVETEAARVGHSSASLRRARVALGVKSLKIGDAWCLKLPEPLKDEATMVQGSLVEEDI